MGIGKGSGRGGARANSGRKSVDGAEWVVAIHAYLDQDSADLVEEYGGGSVGIRLALTELRRLQSTAKSSPTISKRAAVGTPTPIPPKRRVVPEHKPEHEGGGKYHFMVHARMQEKADAEYLAAMVEYKKNTGAR